MISNSNLIKQYNNLLKKSGVYFLKLKIPNSSENYIKIGNAVTLKNRLGDLQTGCPFDLNVVAFIPLSKNKKILQIEEKRAHLYFGHHHYNGEWYKNIEHLVKDYSNLRIKDLTNHKTDKEVI